MRSGINFIGNGGKDNFKIGDKVKCVNNKDCSQHLFEGYFYTVTSFYKDAAGVWYIKTQETGNKGWFMRRFDKVNFIMRSKPDPGRFENHRRIIL
jgi:hypothetical protein